MRGKPPHSPQAVVSSESMWPCLACALRAAHGRHPAPSFPLRALFARRFGPADPLYPQVHQGRRAGRPGDSAARAVCSAGSWSMSPRLCHVRSLAEPWPFLFRLLPPPLLPPYSNPRARTHARPSGPSSLRPSLLLPPVPPNPFSPSPFPLPRPRPHPLTHGSRCPTSGWGARRAPPPPSRPAPACRVDRAMRARARIARSHSNQRVDAGSTARPR